jgi:ubiquinone biosynthesis UbiH/UbiF/VisC/COQ6 family hydroxylase
MNRAQIVVVGAGPVGLATAAALSARLPAEQATVHLLDAGPPPAVPSAEADWDLRVFAASRASHRLLDRVGAWGAIPADRRQPYAGMAVWDEAARLRFDAGELGFTELGHIVENIWIRAAIFCEMTRTAQVEMGFEERLDRVEFEGDSVRIATDRGKTLTADLLVAADGATSATRRLAGLGAEGVDHQAVALVCHLECERPHDAIARQRFLPTGPLALLPLADGRVSLVWSTTPEDADTTLALDDATFGDKVSEASAYALGALRATTERMSFPLRSMRAEPPARAGLVLVGDAAHTVHPLAGQGMNLGLLDAAALADVVTDAVIAGESPGAMRVLRRFHRRRDQHNRIMQGAFGLIDRTFRAESTAVTLLRRAGLGAVGTASPLRNFLARRAMGIDGDLPELMREQVGPLV